MSMTGKYWDRPWSLVDGCTPCSPGCDHCWSAAITNRFYDRFPDGPYLLSVKDGNKFEFSGNILLHPDRLNIPRKVKKPTVWCIWNDFFHENIPTSYILDAFRTMGGAFHHTYLILTKRPARMRGVIETISESLHNEGRARIGTAWDHVWLGVTVCNQAEADKKIPLLLQTPAAHRWISIEPMIGPVDKFYGGSWFLNELDAVILGGETGPGARPMSPDWVRTVRDQCHFAGVPFFFKGWGKHMPPLDDVFGDRDILPATVYFGQDRHLDGIEHNHLPWRNYAIQEKIV
jgi:protein gp37